MEKPIFTPIDELIQLNKGRDEVLAQNPNYDLNGMHDSPVGEVGFWINPYKWEQIVVFRGYSTYITDGFDSTKIKTFVLLGYGVRLLYFNSDWYV
jgi:hypothetical protein